LDSCEEYDGLIVLVLRRGIIFAFERKRNGSLGIPFQPPFSLNYTPFIFKFTSKWPSQMMKPMLFQLFVDLLNCIETDEELTLYCTEEKF
jgi:hypothetical protein